VSLQYFDSSLFPLSLRCWSDSNS